VKAETKEQSKQWINRHSPKKLKKYKQTLSAIKLMATVFWDRKGVLLVEFMQQGTTITSEVHCKTLRKLCRAIQNKRCGMLTSGVMLIHDNSQQRTTARTSALLEHFNWELTDHPSYSPDLALSDYDLFTYLKNWLGSQRFNNNDRVDGRFQNVAELTGGRLL
jgi:histone-lysine N-methyltransferase SETMAR